jgi:glutathione synthase/RimK-type ligase-like ATP-grasp enzyme
MADGSAVLLLCERDEVNSWNPVLTRGLADRGDEVATVHDLPALRRHELTRFDICLPRFRVRCASMSCLDEAVVRAGVPMLNSRECRRACENKAIAHLAFAEHGIAQPASLVVSCEGVRDREPSWSGETLIKPLYGNRGAGIEILPSLEQALERAVRRREDFLVQEMIWPARCWRIIVGRRSGVVDPYWRRPPGPEDRVLSISTGSKIVRDDPSPAVETAALAMLAAVDGDLLAVDVLERDGDAYALEVNHNFDAHGGDEPAIAAFHREIEARLGAATPSPA